MAKRVERSASPFGIGELCGRSSTDMLYPSTRRAESKKEKPLNPSFCGSTVTLPFSLARPFKVEARRGKVSAVLESDDTLFVRGVQGLLGQHTKTTGATTSPPLSTFVFRRRLPS